MWTQKPPLGVPLDFGNPLNKGIVMHLGMNEEHGDRMQDLSLNCNHGKLHNFAYPPTLASGWTPGPKGIVSKLDGTDDYIDCGHGESLDITEEITIEVWIRHLSGVQGYVLSKNQTTSVDAQYAMFYDHGRIVHYPSSTLRSAVIDTGKWYQVILTRNSSGVGQFYLNGHKSGNTQSINMPSKPTYHLRLGCRWKSTEPWFCGNKDMSLCRVLNRAYTPKEVLERSVNPYNIYLEE